MLSARNIQNRCINFDDFRWIRHEDFIVEHARTQVSAQDILLTIVGSIGRLAVVPNEAEPFALQRSVAVLKPSQALESRYLAYALESPAIQTYFSENAKGTAQKGIYLGALSIVEVPLAPRREQKAIADKLDLLLARVDACRQRLDRVPAILKRFRQSVLAAATSGELTREWRAERSIKLSSWRETTFEEICTDITVGFVGKMADQYRPHGVPFLRSQNVRPFRFDANEIKYISPEFHRSIQKSTLHPGDVVVVRTGAPGQCCVIPAELEEANCSDLVIVRPSNELHAAFAVVFINSETSQSFVKAEQVGVAQAHFNVGSMKRAPIHLPSLAEQVEIARRVDDIFSSLEQLEVRYEAARGTVEKVTAALLAKAFRGELVPQDPNDEPASVLLERIRAERAAAGHSQPRRRQPIAPEKQEESAKASATPTPMHDSSSQTASTRPRRQPSPDLKLENTSAPYRRPLEDYTTDEMMSHFRAASRASGEMTEEGLFHLVLARLGFERLGAKVTPILKGHLKAAIGRGIIERDGFFVRSKTPTIRHYDRSTLVDALTSVMRKNHPYEREEVIQALAVHLGYSSVSDVMRDTMKSVFNSAIRQGVLIREGSTIRRGD